MIYDDIALAHAAITRRYLSDGPQAPPLVLIVSPEVLAELRMHRRFFQENIACDLFRFQGMEIVETTKIDDRWRIVKVEEEGRLPAGQKNQE